MRKGFWSGLITGGLVGTAMTLFIYPQLKPQSRAAVARSSQGLRQGASRFWQRAKEGVARALVRRLFR